MTKVAIEGIKDLTSEEFERKLEAVTRNVSPLDALIELVRRLGIYETKYGMTSKEFYARFMKGELGDAKDFIAWAGTYELFLERKRRLEIVLMRVAEHYVAAVPA